MISQAPLYIVFFLRLTLLLPFVRGLVGGGGLKVVAVGGSGRVGASTIKQLLEFADEEGLPPLSIAVAGRSIERFVQAQQRTPSLNSCSFMEVDLEDHSSLVKAIKGADLVVHTAGPFQGKTTPEVLDAALECGVAYVDVCDETELVREVKGERNELAKKAGVPCVVSAGIWPGISAVMAREAEEALGLPLDSCDYFFYTAGTGNAGPTIVSATFLLLCTPVLTYLKGMRKELEPWSGEREVDFGEGAGVRKVRLLDCPDVFSVHKALGVPNVTSRFCTSPEIWNQLFGFSKTVMPPSLLANRNAMQGLALFSEPIVRAVDKLVGAANIMVCEAKSADGRGVVVKHSHPDLEEAVGIGTAAFCMEILKGCVEPGIFWPSEMESNRAELMRRGKKGAKYTIVKS